MSPTVHELRNEIRAEVGRFEREVAASFTKEELAAIANEVGYEVDGGSLPSKSQMRAGIRWRVELSETEAAASDGPFTKDELEAIASHLDIEAAQEE
ncbi:MAG: hypothetical protein V5A15_02740 [Haloarcula sp.]